MRAIRIKSLPNSHRVDKFAIVTFADPVDVVKALEDSRNKRIFGSLIEAKKLLSSNDERYPIFCYALNFDVKIRSLFTRHNF